jgi:hypothetical protein
VTEGRRVILALDRLVERRLIAQPFPRGLPLRLPVSSELTIRGLVFEPATGPEGRLVRVVWDYGCAEASPRRVELFEAAELDLESPAALGFLMAWLREASGTPKAHVMFASSIAAWVCSTRYPGVEYVESYVSDVDAVANALCIMAGVFRLTEEG